MAPKKIDPKLLDPKHVFAELDLNPAKRANVLQQKKEGRHRDGYEPGVTLLYKEMSATDFVEHKDALQVLTDYNKIVFGAGQHDEQLRSDASTTGEILECCKDLRVLGKREFRNLLRWRDSMRKALGLAEERAEKPGGAAAAAGEEAAEEEDEEARVLSEVELLRRQAAARDKRGRRKEREKKAKYQRRIDLKMEDPNDVLALPEEQGLFSLRQVDSAARLAAVSDGTPHADAYAEAASDTETESEAADTDGEESEAEEERRRRRVEAELDELYASYCERTGLKAKRAGQGRKARRAADDQLLAQARPGAAFMAEPSFVPDLTRGVCDDDEGGEEEEEEAGRAPHPLLDDLGAAGVDEVELVLDAAEAIWASGRCVV